MVDSHTIIAQSTPLGSGAIALIRLSGPHAVAIVDQMARFAKSGKSFAKSLANQPSHTIHFGEVVDAGQATIDQVLFLLMRAPQTFTGEDVVEISCHNNPFIIKAIIARAIELGARSAQRGEFTRRAVENGKIDLVKAEAINELIGAQTELALQKSLAQLAGSLSHWIAGIENELVRALALCEASFEFLEEETDFAPEIAAGLAQVLDQIAQVEKTHSINNQIRQGIRIAIIGTVNAGKSSLFNRLLGHERAIVTPIAGTTRDTVEASVDRAGIHWTLIDTAGIRQTADEIEQEGIRRSLEEARRADIVILTFDAMAPLSADLETVYAELVSEFGSKIIPVTTKCDLVKPVNSRSCPSIHFFFEKTLGMSGERATQDNQSQSSTNHQSTSQNSTNQSNNQDFLPPLIPSVFPEGPVPQEKCIEGHERSCIPLSNKIGTGFQELEAAITQKIQALFASANAPFLINQRHHDILKELEIALKEINAMLTSPMVHYELVAHHLRDALERTSQLSGKSVSEAAMDRIFQDFCVGK